MSPRLTGFKPLSTLGAKCTTANVKLVNALEQWKAFGETRKMAATFITIGLVVLDEFAKLALSPSGIALLFHRLSQLRKSTSIVITINFGLSEKGRDICDVKMPTALLNQLTYQC